MKSDSIHIVGAGIVGLCTAWYLKKAGFRVTLIDANDNTEGTSFGNAGMIVPSHFVPMAAPGVISQGLKWMLNSKSPFYIKPRLNLDLVQWLWHFFQSANAQHVTRSIPVLYELNEKSKALYREMASEAGFAFGFQEKGLLMLYQTQKQAEEEEKLAEKAHKLGVTAEILDADGLKKLEPEMDLEVLGGLYFPGDAHLYPNQLMEQLKAHLKQSGVTFLPNTTVVDFKCEASKIEALVTDKNEVLPIKKVLLTTGSWSGLLLKKAGVKLHVQDGKGYSITLKNPVLRPRIPTLLSEAKVAVTPMGQDLRIGGTLEISGLSKKIDQQRIRGILESVPKYYKNLTVPFDQETPIWQGYRPCTQMACPTLVHPRAFPIFLWERDTA